MNRFILKYSVPIVMLVLILSLKLMLINKQHENNEKYKNNTDYQVMQIISEMNQNLPLMLDKATRLDEIKTSLNFNLLSQEQNKPRQEKISALAVEYHFTVLDSAAKEGQKPQAWQENVKSKMLENLCKNNEMSLIRDLNIPLIYIYKTEAGDELLSSTIDVSDC